MPLDDLVLRLTKGSPLTALEGDNNLKRVRDFLNSLELLFMAAFKNDGTLKDNVVTTAALQDRAVTQPKLHWLANFFAVASGTDTYSATISPTTSFTYGDGSTGSFLCLIKFTNANTGAATLNVDAGGAKSIKKNVSQDLSAGDLPAGSIALLAYDGTNFQILSLLALSNLGPGMVSSSSPGGR